jgi:hypothetical protein
MPNQTFALEWLDLSQKHILTAKLLIKEKHFTDSIAIEVQQAIEKALKPTHYLTPYKLLPFLLMNCTKSLFLSCNFLLSLLY